MTVTAYGYENNDTTILMSLLFRKRGRIGISFKRALQNRPICHFETYYAEAMPTLKLRQTGFMRRCGLPAQEPCLR
jgi:hypothetical protein